jgi:hypothetical protein
MGSLPEMGGPIIGKEYYLPCTVQYKIKHFKKKVAFKNKWDMCDENGVVIFEAIKEKPNPNAPNLSCSFKYETQVQDVQGKLVTCFKFEVSCNLKKTPKQKKNSIIKSIISNWFELNCVFNRLWYVNITKGYKIILIQDMFNTSVLIVLVFKTI